MDISKRFMPPGAQSWMRDVLYSLKQQQHLYAIEEFSQPVFHVMVYRNYASYVRELKKSAAEPDD